MGTGVMVSGMVSGMVDRCEHPINKYNKRHAKFVMAKVRFVLCTVSRAHNTSTHYRRKIGHTEHTPNSKTEAFKLHLQACRCNY